MRARPVRFSRQHRVALVRHGRGALLAGARRTPRPPAPRCAAGGGSRSPAARPTRRRRRAWRRYMAWRSRGITWVETGSGVEAHLVGDVGFDARIDVGEGADGAGDARRSRPPCAPRPAAARPRVELGVGVGELEAEGGRLGVDAVAAADGRRHLVLERAPLQRGEQRVDVGDAAGRRRASAAR